MKKTFFPLFLLCMFILPLTILYIADKDGAITNSIEKESCFVNFIDQEAIQNLSTEEKKLLTDRFDGDSIDLKTCVLNSFSKKYSDGSFRCLFFNDIFQDKDWYQYKFSERLNGDYYSLKLRTGIFEKIYISESKSGSEILLFEHYLPLRQDGFNTLEANFIGNHLIISLNNRILFHLLFEGKVSPGKISFSANASDRWNKCKAEFTSMPDEIKNKMNIVISKIPYTLLKKPQ